MIRLLKIWIILLGIIFISTAFTYAELPGNTCKVHGKIIGFDEYFRKWDCFKLTKLKVQRDNGRITEFTAVTRYHDTCFKAYFHGGYQIQDVLTLPQFIPDYKQFGKTYYFKVEEGTIGNVYAFSGGIDKETASKIPIDNIGEIPVDSIMSGYYTEEPSDFKSLPECYGYNFNIEKNQEIKKTNSGEKDIYKYLIFGIIFGMILTLIINKVKK